MDTDKRTNSHQKPSKWSPKLPKSSPKPSKIEGRHATFFARRGSGRQKIRKRTSTQAKRGEDTTAYPHFDRKSCQHGAKWASKIEPKSIKNRCKNRSKKLMPFTIDFEIGFGGFFGAKVEASCTKMSSKTAFSEDVKKRIWS